MSRDKSSHSPGKMPSQRQLRVGEQLRHVIVEILQKGKFHNEVMLNKSHLVTITEVQSSPDLKNATVFFIILGDSNPEHIKEITNALNECRFYFQKEIGKVIHSKSTPRLYFKMDNSFENASKIEHALHSVRSNQGADQDATEHEYGDHNDDERDN